MTFLLVSSFPILSYLLIDSHVTVKIINPKKNQTKNCPTAFPYSGIPNRGKRDKFGIRITEFRFRFTLFTSTPIINHPASFLFNPLSSLYR